ncbi:MAG: hemolysin family protein [Acidimicrobiales bacterium]
MTGLLLSSVGALIALAAFLAMAETSLTRTSAVRAKTLAAEGKRGGLALQRLVSTPERFLNPVLLLVLICHLLMANIVAILAEDAFGAAGVAIAVLAEVVVIFVFSEAAPKTYAVQHSDRAALLAAPLIDAIVSFPPIRILSRVLIWLANVVAPGGGLKQGPFVSEAELLAMTDVAMAEGVVEAEEKRLIHSIIEFGDTVVREVMIPRTDMVSVEARATVDDAALVVMAAGFSRIPVYEQGIDDIAGILYTKDLMRAAAEGKGSSRVGGLVRPARFVPEFKRVAELLPDMQKAKAHMAIVVDEHGGTAGLVTLEDLIEELVGEIVDEYDVEVKEFERLEGGEFVVTAKLAIDELNELLGATFPEGEYDTVGGLLQFLLGHLPAEGEAVKAEGYRLVAERVQGRRVVRVRFVPEDPDNAEAADSAPADSAPVDSAHVGSAPGSTAPGSTAPGSTDPAGADGEGAEAAGALENESEVEPGRSFPAGAQPTAGVARPGSLKVESPGGVGGNERTASDSSGTRAEAAGSDRWGR